MTHSEATAALHTLAQQIAPLLGDGWSYKDTSGDHWATITHTDGRGLSLSMSGGWGKKDPRLCVSGAFPSYTDEDGRSQRVLPSDLYDPKEENPEITVSPKKTPAVIVQDIERRFLPNYSRIWERCQQKKANAQQYADGKAGTARAMAAVPGVQFHGKEKGEVRFAGWVKFDGATRRSADYRVNGIENIEIEAHGLTVDQARAVIALLQSFSAPRAE